LRIVVRQKPDNDRAIKFLENFSRRVPNAMRGFVEHVADDVLGDVQAFAPPNEIDGYPEMLGLYSMPTTGSAVAVGILPPPWAFSQTLRAADATKMVLWVKPKLRAGEAVSEAAVILERRNPWKMDTMPYVPKKNEAEIISQRLTAREALDIGVQRAADVAETAQELQDAGFRIRPVGEVELGRRVTRDVMREVARLEFGYDRQGAAHWRPALRGVPGIVRRRGNAMFAWLTSDDSVYDSGVDIEPGRASSLRFVQRFQAMVR